MHYLLPRIFFPLGLLKKENRLTVGAAYTLEYDIL